MHSLDIHTIFNLIVVEMKYVLSRLCNMLENFFFLIFFLYKGGSSFVFQLSNLVLPPIVSSRLFELTFLYFY